MSKKISELTTATDVTVNDFFQVVDLEDPTMASSGTNKKVSARTLGNNLPVTATGSSASRTLKDRFADTVNVKDFGAVGDGVTDDTAAIQAAIDSNSGKTIYFPSGIYKFTQQLRIKRDNTCLIGSARNSTQLWYFTNTNQPAILVQAETANPNFPSIAGISIENIGLNKLTGTTQNSVGIEFDRGLSCMMTDCYVSGFPSAIITSGCRNCYFSNLNLNSSNAISNTVQAAASVVTIKDSTSNGNYTGFTIVYDHCIIGATFVSGTSVRISGNDYASFSNCYISGATVQMVDIVGGGDHTYDCWFDQCYFDGALAYTSNPTPLGVHIRENSPSAQKNAIHNFTDCTFGQMDNAVFIDEEVATEIGFVGCRFRYCYESGISCNSNDADVRIIGCTFRDSVFNLPQRSVISVSSVSSLVVSSNIFYFQSDKNPHPTETRVILISGSVTAETISITGNTFTSDDSNITDYEVGVGATIGKLTITGNASNNATNTIVGNVIGNSSNSNPVSLDWYEEGTFAPSISFGGSSTGVTYETRTASVTRIGNRVFFTLYAKLSSKGSSTGDLQIGTLPYTVNTTYPSNYTISCGALNTGVGDSNIDAVASTDANKIFVRKQVAGTATTITDADVTNTTYFNITGSYQVA